MIGVGKRNKRTTVLGLLAAAILGLLIITWTGQREKPVKEENVMQPDYARYITATFQDLTKQVDFDVVRKRIYHTNTGSIDIRKSTNFAALSWRMYALTGKQEYLDYSKKTWDILFEEWRKHPDLYKKSQFNSFFIGESLMVAYEGLKQKGLVSTEDEAVLKDALKVTNVYQPGDNNQALSRMVGTFRSLAAFPNHPDAGAWKSNVERGWNNWYRNKDITENASGYMSISLMQAIKLAKLRGTEQELLNPEVRSMFTRCRDMVAPSGAIPEYGDDYFMEWTNWVYVFESAARLYRDPSFLTAADKVFRFGTAHYPMTNNPGNFSANLDNLTSLFWMSDLLYLESTSLKPAEWPRASAVLHRSEPGNPKAADKLILSASGKPGAPFVMSELFGRGSHAHTNRTGAIQYYEAGGIPLYHGMARHNKGATDSNIVAMLPQISSHNYPYGETKFEPDTWYTESIPAHLLNLYEETDEAGGNKATFKELTLRLDAGTSDSSQPFDLIIDNLRLEGPAGVLMIDDFETLGARWMRQDQPYTLSKESTNGKAALQVTVKPKASLFYATREHYNVPFDVRDYTTIKYDWKYKAPARAISFIFRLNNDSGLDTKPGDVNMMPVVRNPRAEDKSKDSYGEYTLDNYFGFDTSLTRKMVLTEEGFLIVQDRLQPGKSTDGYVAGPVWQQYSPGDKGANWFDSQGEMKTAAGQRFPWKALDGTSVTPLNVLVYFDQAEGRTFGVQKASVTNNPTPASTVYAKQLARAGQPVTFVSVLVPHAPEEAAAEVAGRISVQTTGGLNSAVTIKPAGSSAKPVTIRIESADWSVRRE
ncbi:hypothetical protein ACFQI7_08030 [Paenibacillus allorhizosphaerae]|uniref:Heparinase n=1 Tax=Paenibacillus allorhizosphaerae TaxID=2849866 RepID=A0ABN7TLW5_9BACL|nr:hypothetical protein [Paenibacillus allorhizosphaerae]CAG7638273.1 hypothetical protein PAECIP111802_02423 [Paenibacillus allorhizosphaerae]